MEQTNENLYFDAAVLTETGWVRKNNEDSVFVAENIEPGIPGADSYGIYLIADGMGGQQAGEVASRMATEIISRTLSDSLKSDCELPSMRRLVELSIQRANKEIARRSADSRALHSMGTTATLGFRFGHSLHIGHVGDSRAYLIRDQGIEQLTEDHSVVARLLKVRAIRPYEAREHPKRGIIFRCLGASDEIVVDTLTRTLRQGDSLVFCSDGLTSHVTDNEILKFVGGNRCAGEACRMLVDLANARGGLDNISIIVVYVKSK